MKLKLTGWNIDLYFEDENGTTIAIPWWTGDSVMMNINTRYGKITECEAERLLGSHWQKLQSVFGEIPIVTGFDLEDTEPYKEENGWPFQN